MAQTGTATLEGDVQDPSKAVIPGAGVTITDVGTGILRNAKANAHGHFAFAGLKPATYSVQITSSGFKNDQITGVVLNTGDDKEITVVLQLGGASETVTVTAGNASLNTEESSVSTVVDREYIENQPLNGRSFQDLYLLTPGTTTTNPATLQNGGNNQQNGSISVNGQSANSNNFTVDGASASTGGGNWNGFAGSYSAGTLPAQSALGTTQNLVSVDDLQEFRVETSSFAAEYGPTPGGQFSFTTRSGTNAFHGDAFDYLRNGYFDANDVFNDRLGVKQPALKQNDFGGTFGGPVLVPHIYNGQNKTFFFVNYEGLRLSQPTEAVVAYVPSDMVRAVMTSTPPPGNTAAIVLSLPTAPASNNVCNDGKTVATEPGCTSSGYDGTATYNRSYSNPSTINSTSVRIDHAINNHETAFFRFADTPSSSGQYTLAQIYNIVQNTQTYTFGLTSTPTNRLTNEFRVNYTNNYGKTEGAYVAEPGAVSTNVVTDFGYPATSPSYYLGIGYYATGYWTLQVSKNLDASRQVNLTDALTYTIGKHAFKIGGLFRKFATTNLPETPLSFQDWYTYSPYNTALGDLQSGIIDDASVYTYASTFPVFRSYAVYAQDNFHLSPRLTLNYGLRWDIAPAPTSNHGRVPYNLTNLYDPQSVAVDTTGNTLYNTDFHSIAPRFGFSYLANSRPGGETIVRGGFGVFYDLVGDQANALAGSTGPGQAAANFWCRPNFCSNGPQGLYNLPGPSNLINPKLPTTPTSPYNVTAYGIPHNLTNPYTFEYNLALQQSLSPSDNFSVTYVGSLNRKQVGYQAYYAYPVNPNFQVVENQGNFLSSSYNALQVVYTHRMSRGLYLYGSYNWAHNIGDTQLNPFSPPQHTAMLYDVRNSFNTVLSYDLPGSYVSGLKRALLKGWGTDVRESIRSGFPFQVFAQNVGNSGLISGNTKLLTPLAYSPAYLSGAVPLYIKTSNQYSSSGVQLPAPGGRALNPAAFVPETISNTGVISTANQVPNNSLYGFGALQTNMAVRRDFPIHERLHLQFRAESFNIFNHPQWGAFDSKYGDQLFGQAVNSLANGLAGAGFGGQYNSGGPRSMQFTLKLLF